MIKVHLKLLLQSATALLIPNRDESKHYWITMPLEEAMEELHWNSEIVHVSSLYMTYKVRKILDRVPVESMRGLR